MGDIDDALIDACARVKKLKQIIENSSFNEEVDKANRDFLMKMREILHGVHVSFYEKSDKSEAYGKAKIFVDYLDKAIDFYASYCS